MNTVRFGAYSLDLKTGELDGGGGRVHVPDKPFQILVTLLEKPGELVTREELRQRLWPANSHVDFDHSMNNALNRLRETLGDDAEHPQFIETLPRRGYRFIAPVEFDSDAPLGVGTTVAEPAPGHSRRWMIAASLLVLLIAAGVLLRQRFDTPSAAVADRVMLVVLPFENLTGEADQEYLSDGFTEEVISRLARLGHERMGVIARTSAMAYKGSRKPVDQVGRELHVDYLLEGSLRRSGERLRITAQLIRVADQTHLWSRDFDRALTDVVLVQSEIAGAIAEQIQLRLPPSALARAASPAAVDPEAYRLHLLGRYYWSRRTPDALRKSLEAYLMAVERDSAFAAGFAGLADTYNSLGSYSVLPPAEAFPLAKSAALRALELDPMLAQAHNSLAFVHENYEWDWAVAEKEYRRALELDPADANTLHWYAAFLWEMGRFEECLELSERAHQLDPLSMIVRLDLAAGLERVGRSEEARKQMQTILEIDPVFAPAHAGLGWSLEQEGRLDDAIASFRKAIEHSPGNHVYSASLAHALAQAGRRDEAQRILESLRSRAGTEHVSPYIIGIVYAGLGERDRAFEYLELAYQERDSWLVFMKVQHWLDPLRGDPRFDALLRKMNLAEA